VVNNGATVTVCQPRLGADYVEESVAFLTQITDVSEEPGASFIRVTKIGELGTTQRKMWSYDSERA
jgi:hypothetical protein